MKSTPLFTFSKFIDLIAESIDFTTPAIDCVTYKYRVILTER